MKSVKGFYGLSQGLLRIVYCRSNGAELSTLFKGFKAGPNNNKEIDFRAHHWYTMFTFSECQ